MLPLLSLALGTLASEDLACVAAALLIQQGTIPVFPAIAACTVGIVAGDLGLWAAGRLWGRAALRWRWSRRGCQGAAMVAIKEWLTANPGAAILASRFLPGTRLPLYLAAGMTNVPLAIFAGWSLVASSLWTPALVLFTVRAGKTASSAGIENGEWQWLLTGGFVMFLLQAIKIITQPSKRRQVAVRLSRAMRWEFWPMWLFYSPVAIWIGVLAVRHRGFATMTAANPGIPDGGTVGESKCAILQRLPPESVIPFAAIGPGDPKVRIGRLAELMRDRAWAFPVVLKPDIGQRGAGVKLARSLSEASAYLSGERSRVLVQPFHPGPFEAGVFYYRMPDWARGRILSITDKQFPYVIGDGRSSLAQLVLEHPRYRMQAHTFLERYRDADAIVPGAGQHVQLAIAGNHAQGTMFRDGQHLWTPALERRIDDIARAYDGFFVGRFDIRYSDVEAFKAGRDIAIVELNGATAESTNIYDPDATLVAAYRQLFIQWQIVFAIGAANRAAGSSVTSTRRLIALVREHFGRRVAFPVSD